MSDRIANNYNPLALGDKDELVRRLVDLLPKSEEDTRIEEEIRLFNKARKRRQEAYQEARYGQLPEHTYRILEQGSIVGWYYELELDGQPITLMDTDNNQFALFGQPEKAIELAKQHIAEKLGQTAADKSEFRFLFGGQL